MKYPKLREIPTTRDMISAFKGYNHNIRIEDSEFYDMKNLTSDRYPVLSPRAQRGVFQELGMPVSANSISQGIIAKNTLCYIDGDDFVITKENREEDIRVTMGFSRDEKPKKMTTIGAYVIIMPDKKYINTEAFDEEGNCTDYGNIELSFVFSEEDESIIEISLCDENGVKYIDYVSQSTPPTNPEHGAIWVDTSKETLKQMQYSATEGKWNEVTDSYVMISSSNVQEFPFDEGDGIHIDIDSSMEQLSHLNGENINYSKSKRYLVVRGVIKENKAGAFPMTITRWMPNMDFIIESGNRLWGCRYGTAHNGQKVNEIYASKLGDFKNWNYYKGISTDSYTASVGSDGAFTGAIAHGGYPLFFKETCIHKVYGSYPAQYQIQTIPCRGVQKGCEGSLAIVNEVLYYKSQSGVCAYDGSLPVEISAAFGEVQYKNAVGGSLGNKYYVSMADPDNYYHLFVYDTMKGMWHKEDEVQAIAFAQCDGELYFIEHGDNTIHTVKGTGTKVEDPVKWEAVTGVIGTDSPDKKYVSSLDVRMSMSVGTRVSFFAEYDSSGEWEYLFAMQGINLRTFPIPIKPKRCDHFRLKIVGVGEAKIFSICKTTEQGSDA